MRGGFWYDDHIHNLEGRTTSWVSSVLRDQFRPMGVASCLSRTACHPSCPTRKGVLTIINCSSSPNNLVPDRSHVKSINIFAIRNLRGTLPIMTVVPLTEVKFFLVKFNVVLTARLPKLPRLRLRSSCPMLCLAF